MNFNRLLVLLTPTFLREKVFHPFWYAVSTALESCKTDIDNFFSDMNYHVRVTPQLFSLEKMLNDKCDPILRRIEIRIPEPEQPFYFTENGNPTVPMKYFGGGVEKQFFMGRTAYAYDFGVYLPKVLKSNDMDNIVTALLNRYKIITKSFLIFYV